MGQPYERGGQCGRVRGVNHNNRAANIAVAPTPSASKDPFPSRRRSSWTARDFRFQTGEVLPELELNCPTIGEPIGIFVVVLHGRNATAESMRSVSFGGARLSCGQPLDTGLSLSSQMESGLGTSSKRSDGLRSRFPWYNYKNMVDAHFRLLTEDPGVEHLRLIVGLSLGSMLPSLGRALSGFYGRTGSDGVLARAGCRPQMRSYTGIGYGRSLVHWRIGPTPSGHKQNSHRSNSLWKAPDGGLRRSRCNFFLLLVFH